VRYGFVQSSQQRQVNCLRRCIQTLKAAPSSVVKETGMQTIVRRYVFLLFAASLIFAISPFANADNVEVSGTANMGNLNEDLSVRAGILSASVTVPDDLGPSNLGFGTVGVPLTLSFGFSGAFTPGFASVSIGSQFTDFASASFLFKTSLFTVSTLALANGTITIPVTVSGELSAYRGPGTLGLMASLQFAGTGTATLQLVDENLGTFVIQSTNVEFNNINGTLTTVPEPASLFLLGTGLSGFVLTWKRRWYLSKKPNDCFD
jgi:hypothetical protein